MNGNMSENILLKSSDVINVPRDDARKIFVMGEVKQPQTLKMDRVGMSLAEALVSSRGFNAETSDASGVFVLRVAPSKDKLAQIYQLDVTDATALVLADRFKLKSSDIVFVTSTAISKWNRVVNQLLPRLNYYGMVCDYQLMAIHLQIHWGNKCLTKF